MRTEAIDPPGITWLRVSPKYVTVRLASWALANLFVVGLLCIPLVLVLNGDGRPSRSGWPSPSRP